MKKHLARLDPKRVPFLAGGVMLLVVAALLVYCVLPQFRAWRTASTDRDRLQLSVEAARSVAADRQRLVTELQSVETALHGDAESLSQQALEAFIVGRLQDISWRRGIELVSVQPMPAGTIGAIQETSFKLELAGGYTDLRAWLGDIAGELGFMTVKQLAMAPLEGDGGNPRLHAALILAAYRGAT